MNANRWKAAYSARTFTFLCRFRRQRFFTVAGWTPVGMGRLPSSRIAFLQTPPGYDVEWYKFFAYKKLLTMTH
nr:hypothetical protein [Evansella caseinilytica]